MKSFIITTFFMISTCCIGQNLDYKNLKNFIGNRVTEFETFYDVQPTKVDDNFGNVKTTYDNVVIATYTLSILIETEGKNIKKITVSNTENRTKFFQNMASEIEKNTPEKKNYKTVYISLVKNATKRKTYFETVSSLIDVLKKPSTNLKESHGFIESNSLNAFVVINDTSSTLTVN